MTFPAVVCLQHLLPYVGNIGTIGTNGITNGTIGKTLNGICLPMVPFLPLEKTTNARNVGNIGSNGITNGTIGKTLNGICLPMVPFLPLVARNATDCG